MRRLLGGALALLTALQFSAAQAQTPLTGAITYQGRLIVAGVPATGSYDFRFYIYDAATGGEPLAGPLSPVAGNPQAITGGLVSVKIDIPTGTFVGSKRWVGLEYKPTGSSTWIGFSERLELTPAPHAIFAMQSASATQAESALFADSATTAYYSDSSAYAESAGTAANADQAENATHSETSDQADVADYATSAGSASTATTAANAGIWSGTSSSLVSSQATARTTLGLGSVALDNVVPITRGGTGATDLSAAKTALGIGGVAGENIVPITKGGTGATSQGAAQTALGLGTVATESVVPITKGGTGATSQSAAQTALGLGTVAIESTVPLTKGGTGATSASAARTQLGLGTVATESTVPIAKGGTGATTQGGARTALGLAVDQAVTFARGTLDAGTSTSPVFEAKNSNSAAEQVRLSGNTTGTQTRHASFFVSQSGSSAGSVFSIAANLIWGTTTFKMGHSGTSTSRPAWLIQMDTGDNSEGGNYFSLWQIEGNGQTAPASYAQRFTVDDDGIVYLYETTNSSPGANTASGAAKFYVHNNYMYAQDNSGTAVQLTSHFPPELIELLTTGATAGSNTKSHSAKSATQTPTIETSFSDPSIAMPWSFHHHNALVGKGAVVDMAKLVKFVEAQMQAQLGASAGQVVYDYDLPESQRVTEEEWLSAQIDTAVTAILAHKEWIEVAVGPNGEVPTECFEEIPVVEVTEQTITKTVKKLDLATRRIVEVQEEVTEKIETATGQVETRLRDNYRFVDGKLYRRPTATDIPAEAIELELIPEWITQRTEAAIPSTSLEESGNSELLRRKVERRLQELSQLPKMIGEEAPSKVELSSLGNQEAGR